jgi:hypothetical protein
MAQVVSLVHELTNPRAAFIVAMLLLLVFGLVRVMNANNPLEWWHFIATRGPDNAQYADIDKLGKCVGIVVGSAVIIIQAYTEKVDGVIFFTYLAFVGAVAGWSAYLRSRQPPGNP